MSQQSQHKHDLITSNQTHYIKEDQEVRKKGMYTRHKLI